MSRASLTFGGVAIVVALAAALAPAGCSPPEAARPGEGERVPAVSAPTTVAAPAPAGTGVTAPADSAMAPPPADSGAAAAPAGTAMAPPADSAAAATATEGPLPDVKVANIGMHIGGGPNDAPTKAPIKQSVEPHFDAFRRCFAKVDDPKKGGDFGVDLRIEGDGGLAKVTKPRTSLKGEGFKECMLGVFEHIEFKKPKGGATVVSYSLRFTP